MLTVCCTTSASACPAVCTACSSVQGMDSSCLRAEKRACRCRFHGGDEPDLADLSVFGVIRSVTCTDTFMDLMHNSRISHWYEQMMKTVGESSRLSAS